MKRNWEFSPSQRSHNNLRSDRIRSIQSEDLWSKFLLFSPFYLSSIACLTSGRIRLSILYQAKTYRQTVVTEIKARDQRTTYLPVYTSNDPLLAGMFHIRWMDIMMKILLPAGFIALKLTGSFIDFMLGLSNSNVEEEINFKTAKARDSWTIILTACKVV